MALDGGFLRLAGRSCSVLRTISVPRGSGMSVPSDIGIFLRVWGFPGDSEVLKGSCASTEALCVPTVLSDCPSVGRIMGAAVSLGSGSFSHTLSSLAGGGKVKRGYTTRPGISIQQLGVEEHINIMILCFVILNRFLKSLYRSLINSLHAMICGNGSFFCCLGL